MEDTNSTTCSVDQLITMRPSSEQDWDMAHNDWQEVRGGSGCEGGGETGGSSVDEEFLFIFLAGCSAAVRSRGGLVEGLTIEG